MLLILLTVSILVIGLCIVLHFNQHFRFILCKEVYRFGNVSRLHCCCGIKNEEFDFFPVSFLSYMVYMLFLSILVVYKYIAQETAAFNIPNQLQTYRDAPIFGFGHSSFHQTLTTTTNLQISSYIDWIIYILLFISMIWKSLFSFYRYHTTIMSTQCFRIFSLYSVFKPFSIYFFIFLALYGVQTQVYYYLFPVLVLFHFVMNMYWIMRVARILIESFGKLTESVKSSKAFDRFQNDLIYNVRLMRNLSIISCLLSSIYVATFVMIYEMDIVYYFPIIWCLSISCFVFNFTRNRQCIRDKIFDPILTCIRGNVSEQISNGVPTITARKTTPIPTKTAQDTVTETPDVELSSTRQTNKKITFLVPVNPNSAVPTSVTVPIEEEEAINDVEIQIEIKTSTNTHITPINIQGIISQSDNIHLQRHHQIYLETPVFDENDEYNHKSHSTGNLMSFIKKKPDHHDHRLPLIDADTDATTYNNSTYTPISENRFSTVSSINMNYIMNQRSQSQVFTNRLNDSQSNPLYEVDMTRSSSNPLIMDEQQRKNNLQLLSAVPEFEYNPHQKSRSTMNDADEFTLMTAVKSMRNKRDQPDLHIKVPVSQHVPQKSSAVSVFNLFVSQGFYDAKHVDSSVKQLHQLTQLTVPTTNTFTKTRA